MSDLLKFLSGSFLGNLAEAALILIAGLIFIKIASSIMKRALSRSHLDEAVHKFIINVIRAVLYIVLTVAILGKLKVPTAPLVTVLGAAGAAIALALKDSLGNIAGGVLILANKLFKKGDVIDVSGAEGMVESIDLFVTTFNLYFLHRVFHYSKHSLNTHPFIITCLKYVHFFLNNNYFNA